MKKKSLIMTVAAVAAVGVIGIGSTFAYFTSTDSATNSFTVGNITASLVDEYTEANGTDILPTQQIDKSVAVTLDSDSNDAYVFLQVAVPTAVVYLEGDTSASEQQLFSYTVGDDWTQVSVDKTTYDDYYVYTYSYDKTITGGETSGYLFTSVTFANIAEDYITSSEGISQIADSIQGESYGIVVTSYAVQSQGLTLTTATAQAVEAGLGTMK